MNEGKEEIGKKIPDKINCGKVNNNTNGRIDSCVLARLPRKNPTHKNINAPNKITPYSGKSPPMILIFKSPIARPKITESWIKIINMRARTIEIIKSLG
jgi:hypothetical protein